MKKLVGLMLVFSLLTTAIVSAHASDVEGICEEQDSTSSFWSQIQDASKVKEKLGQSANNVKKFFMDDNCLAAIEEAYSLINDITHLKLRKLKKIMDNKESAFEHIQKCVKMLKNLDDVNDKTEEQPNK